MANLDKQLADINNVIPSTLAQYMRDVQAAPERYTPEFVAWLERQVAKRNLGGKDARDER